MLGLVGGDPPLGRQAGVGCKRYSHRDGERYKYYFHWSLNIYIHFIHHYAVIDLM